MDAGLPGIRNNLDLEYYRVPCYHKKEWTGCKYREQLIESVKTEVAQMFEAALDSVNKIEDSSGKIQYISDFTDEYIEYNSRKLTEIQDPELRNIITLEMTMVSNEYWSRF